MVVVAVVVVLGAATVVMPAVMAVAAAVVATTIMMGGDYGMWHFSSSRTLPQRMASPQLFSNQLWCDIKNQKRLRICCSMCWGICRFIHGFPLCNGAPWGVS